MANHLRTLKTEQKHLNTLLESKGWNYLKDIVIQDEIMKVAYSLCENKPMDTDQMHFQRGAMWAARRFTSIPDTRLTVVENEIALLEAQEAIEQS
jgi:hypothetical protein